MASTRSDPLIFLFLCHLFHVGFTKYVALLCACVEKGGTTGVLDREIMETEKDGEAMEELAQAQEREHTGITVKQHSKNETTRSPSI